MRYFAVTLLAALLAAAAAVLYSTAGDLPSVVASHFDLAGHANGAMPRRSYLIFTSLMMFGVPLLVAALNIVLPRIAPWLVRIPSRDYWLAPERRDETLSSLAASGVLVASLITALMTALHLLVVEANMRTPPRIDSEPLWVLLALFVAATLVLQLFRWQRFRRPQ